MTDDRSPGESPIKSLSDPRRLAPSGRAPPDPSFLILARPAPALARLAERAYEDDQCTYRKGGDQMLNLKASRPVKEAMDELKEDVDVATGGRVTLPLALLFALTFIARRRTEFFADLQEFVPAPVDEVPEGDPVSSEGDVAALVALA